MNECAKEAQLESALMPDMQREGEEEEYISFIEVG